MRHRNHRQAWHALVDHGREGPELHEILGGNEQAGGAVGPDDPQELVRWGIGRHLADDPNLLELGECRRQVLTGYWVRYDQYYAQWDSSADYRAIRSPTVRGSQWETHLRLVDQLSASFARLPNDAALRIEQS